MTIQDEADAQRRVELGQRLNGYWFAGFRACLSLVYVAAVAGAIVGAGFALWIRG